MNTESFPFFSKEWRASYINRANRVVQSFSLTEKTVFFILAAVFCISGIALLWQVNSAFLVEVPAYGGTLDEGIIGTPRFLNPLLAISDADKDLTSLIYSGLLRVQADGSLTPDLAKSYEISEDGLTYTFVLKDKIYFHDGTPVTADDVIFTIEKAQDTVIKSPRKANWDGVRAEKIDDKTIVFTLTHPYSPFIQNLTLGILPKHIWKAADGDAFPFSQFNTKPIGSGPYKIDSITYTDSGLPAEYHLKAFDSYALGEPYISKLIVKSYQNEKDLISAYKNEDIQDIHGISPKTLPQVNLDTDEVVLSPLPRIFGVFFNQNAAPVFVYNEVRQALDMATDKQAIIDTVLDGYGQPIDEAVPPKTINAEGTGKAAGADLASAKKLLESKGWKLNDNNIYEKKDGKKTVELSFSISTGDAPELKSAAEMLQRQWQALGAEVEVKIFEIGDLNQNIIRPRKYDSLLFGEIIGRDLDLYPFWHSSQRNDPGLNIAQYTNLKADKLLENIRQTTDPAAQQKLYDDFNSEIQNDYPAVFIYSPYFVYIVPKQIHNISIGQLTSPSERFANIYQWYLQTNKVWKIFAPKQSQS